MRGKREWLDPSEWTREGRGRTWSFNLGTRDIAAALSEVADARGSELQLLTCSLVDADGAQRSTFTPQPVEALSPAGPWQHFVRCREFTPNLPLPRARGGVGWPGVFAINGLILLHHPHPGSTDDPPRSIIGIAHRVQNERTGERREHGDYDELFTTIKRALVRRLEQSR